MIASRHGPCWINENRPGCPGIRDKSQMKANEIRPGMAINLSGKLYVVVKIAHTKPGKGPAYIQAKMRGRVQRIRYLRLRAATIKCQAMIRYFLANLEVIRARKKARVERWASTTIQLAYRRYKFRNLGADRKRMMMEAAVSSGRSSSTISSLSQVVRPSSLTTSSASTAALPPSAATGSNAVPRTVRTLIESED